MQFLRKLQLCRDGGPEKGVEVVSRLDVEPNMLKIKALQKCRATLFLVVPKCRWGRRRFDVFWELTRTRSLLCLKDLGDLPGWKRNGRAPATSTGPLSSHLPEALTPSKARALISD